MIARASRARSTGVSSLSRILGISSSPASGSSALTASNRRWRSGVSSCGRVIVSARSSSGSSNRSSNSSCSSPSSRCRSRRAAARACWARYARSAHQLGPRRAKPRGRLKAPDVCASLRQSPAPTHNLTVLWRRRQPAAGSPCANSGRDSSPQPDRAQTAPPRAEATAQPNAWPPAAQAAGGLDVMKGPVGFGGPGVRAQGRGSALGPEIAVL